RIGEVAGAQRGLITVRQLAAIGLSGRTVRDWVAAGRLYRVHRGVYAVGHPVLTPQARWLGAVLACTEGSVLSHRSCAASAGFRRDWAGGVDVTSPTRGGRLRSGIVVHRADLLLSSEITENAGIPSTTVART